MFELRKSYRFIGTLLLAVCLGNTALASPSEPMEKSAKKRVLADLDCIYTMFDVKYAPKPWKKEFSGWDLEQSITEAKNKIKNNPNLTIKESQVIFRDFFNTTKDYHVGATFYSTESATLPFLIKGAEKRYFVCYVDQDAISKRDFPFQVGDEILTFGGRPIDEVVKELRIREYGHNTLETDQAFAELTLTNRRGFLAHLIPSGKVEITGLQKSTRRKLRATLTWRYTPEKILDYSKLGFNLEVEADLPDEEGEETPYANSQSFLTKSQFFDKYMVTYLWDKSYVGESSQLNEYSLGSYSSYIPPLGNMIWRGRTNSFFNAYIFETPSGKRVGYIRIPHYAGGLAELEEFGLTMNHFQKRTDALIIDQINNPGGSLFFLNSLVSMLANKPLSNPKDRIALTQKEVYIANYFLPYIEQVSNDETARLVFGDTFGGYPIDYRFVCSMKHYCNFVIKQWEEGNLLSAPTFLYGFDEIRPHPKYQYSKPIMVLVNSLDFSCADLFPAILQDNQRALIFGTRTAGAGGFVFDIEYPNHLGMKSFSMTGSVAERKDLTPLENLGVRPDIQYDLKAVDLQEDYREYISAILETIESLASTN